MKLAGMPCLLPKTVRAPSMSYLETNSRIQLALLDGTPRELLNAGIVADVHDLQIELGLDRVR